MYYNTEMLTIDLQKIVADINNRRSRVRYEFQETGLMLAEKLNDPRHKAIYMRIAKVEERELVMDALNHVLAMPNSSGNLGALFMWKLKEIKNRPLETLYLRFDIPEGYFRIGVISNAVRGDMPLILAALDLFQEEHAELLSVEVIWVSRTATYATVRVNSPFTGLLDYLTEVNKKYKRQIRLTQYTTWQFFPKRTENELTEIPTTSSKFTGELRVSNPVSVKKVFEKRGFGRGYKKS